MAEFDRVDLEAQLVELGKALVLPVPRDLSSAVLRRLEAARPRRRQFVRYRSTRYRVAAITIAVLALLGAVTPAGQAAVARVVHAFGVSLHFGSPTEPARPERLPGESSTALEHARRQVPFPIVVPESLGPPDQVTVSDGGRVLSLVYLGGPGRPNPGPGGISARLDEFDGTIDVIFLKQLSSQARWMPLPDGDSAVWIGAPHDVVYVDRAGSTRTDSAHLASHTMIWTVGAVTLRLEGDYTPEDALVIAAGTVTTTAPSTPTRFRSP